MTKPSKGGGFSTLPLLALSLLPALAACGGGQDLHPYLRAQKLPLIFAHRGGGGVAPEETIPTMLATHQRVPDAVIEFDVHATLDGVIVVNHDGTVDRATNGTGLIRELTLAQLKALDAGYCATPDVGNGTDETGTCHAADPAAYPFRGMGYQIATLDEVLVALPPETFMSIEIKQAGIEKQVAEVLRATGRLEKMVVGAEFDDMAVRIRDALPDTAGYLPTGAAKCFALSAKAGWSYAACPSYAIFASPLSGAGLALDTRGVIDRAHDEGMAVVYWTINDDPTMARLFKLGADGIYTDYPERAAAVLASLRATGEIK